MTLNRIDPTNLARTQQVDRFQETVKRDDTGKRSDAAASAPAAAASEKTRDRAEISETARRLMEIRNTVDQGRDAMSALPDVRENKVAQARERLAKGYYHSVEVTNDVARKLDKTFDAIDEL